jgi:predicted ATP-dependent endonuclease of OLD family
MSHLISATVHGLAGRKKPVGLKFDRHVNVIYGLNGSGKTSLLKILHSAMSGDASILENVPFTSAKIEIYSKSYDKVFTRSTTTPESQEQNPQMKLPDEIEARRELSDFVRHQLRKQDRFRWVQKPSEPKRKDGLTHWKHRYLPTARLHVSDERFLRSSLTQIEGTLTEELLDRYFADAVQRLWSGYTSQILRAVRDAQERGLESILRAVLSPSPTRRSTHPTLDMDKAYASVSKFLARRGGTKKLGKREEFERRYKTDAALCGVVDDIYQIEQDIDRAMASRRQLQKLIEKLYTGGKHVVFGDEGIGVQDSDGNQIGLASLSSGEKHLMQILVETLLSEDNTILIDEPELSMHIDWQHDLIANLLLLNSDVQLVLATHSPEVMAKVNDEKIFAI